MFIEDSQYVPLSVKDLAQLILVSHVRLVLPWQELWRDDHDLFWSIAIAETLIIDK